MRDGARKLTGTIDHLVELYRPDSLVVGTRGQRLGALAQGLSAGLLGVSTRNIRSVSKCVFLTS